MHGTAKIIYECFRNAILEGLNLLIVYIYFLPEEIDCNYKNLKHKNISKF